MIQPTKTELENIAIEMRRAVLSMLVNVGGGHFGGAYSSVEILVVLYFRIMSDKDKFIMSKAHASVALYALLAKKGIIDGNILNTYGKKGSILGVHAEAHLVPGIEFSSGSLGHGLSYGAGVALANKMNKKNDRVFVLLGDGECQEGSVWEAAMFASHHKLDNLIAIVDYNKLQSMDKIENVIGLEPLVDKWRSFGWKVLQTDGHNIDDLIKTFELSLYPDHKPIVIIAHTIKGKGLSFLENTPQSHYKRLSDEELKIAKKELGT